MRKINLLYVITKLELGGAQKQLLSLIKHLNKQRYNLSLITAQDGPLVDEALSIRDLRLIKSKFLERPINLLKDFLAFCQIYSFIKKNKIDIVHTHSSKAGIIGRWAARLARVKIIIHTVHGWSFNQYQNCFLRWIIILLERLTSGITDSLIVVSRHDCQKGLDNHIGGKHKYKLIRYGIEYKEFTQLDKDLREESGIGARDLLIGMISCFKPQKSPQDFIKLASLVNKVIPQTKFLLVGDGVLGKRIEKLISKFNLEEKVVLTGWRDDIPRILSAIDVFVLTSLWEGLPISALEAMAASLPVIITDTGGVREIVFEGKTGFLVSCGDVNAMAGKLICLLRDKDLRRWIGQNAKHSLGSDFSLEDMIKNTENFYQDLIKIKAGRCVN